MESTCAGEILNLWICKFWMNSYNYHWNHLFPANFKSIQDSSENLNSMSLIRLGLLVYCMYYEENASLEQVKYF